MFSSIILIGKTIVFYVSVSAICGEMIEDHITPTKGEVWPMPQAETKQITYFIFSPAQFQFKVINKKCELLDKAIIRYKVILSDMYGVVQRNRRNNSLDAKNQERDQNHLGNIKEVYVNLTEPCEEYPSFKMDESYSLTISTKSFLISDSIWGMLRGLETVSQLFYITDDFNEVRINATEIFDFPYYMHRGLLVDTARHYIPLPHLLRALDAMAANKMNVFHWHIVDDQSFPYQSQTFPQLSKDGAYFPSMVYTKSNIELLINYAKERGIRVIPEFDMPGHTQSWGKAFPKIITKCTDRSTTNYGPLHPLRKSTYKVIQKLFKEAQQLFPDTYFHVGGDEVDLNCWEMNPEISKFSRNNKIYSLDDIFGLFMSKVFQILGNNSVPIVWQEVYDHGVELPDDTIVQVWRNEWITEVVDILRHNHTVIVSSPWYLDHLHKSFVKMYLSDPRSEIVKRLGNDIINNIVGGEACLWSERVNEFNFHTRIWPRAAAVAEVLWSVTEGRLPNNVYKRIEEHACRLQRRGIPTEPPNSAGFCVT